MRTKLGALLVAAAVVSASVLGGSLLVSEPWQGPGTAPYIVVTDEATTMLLLLDVKPGHVYTNALSGFSAELTDQQVTELEAQGAFVQPDVEVRVFEMVPTGVNRVDAERLWPEGVTGDGVTVAVIDTGIAPVPDLAINEGLSRTFVGGDWRDRHGHGTHVAGTIAARQNGEDVVGVAPGAEVVALKALGDNGWGNLSSVIAALDWVVAHSDEIDVVNMSIGALVADNSRCPTNSAFHRAVCSAVDAGVVLVAAAGNSDRDANGTVPATFDEVLTVSALADSDGQPGGAGPGTSYGPDDSLATFSNWGPDVDLAAPGVNIASLDNDGGVAIMSGTSMASPHVAGIAALSIQMHGSPAGAGGVMALHSRLKEIAAGQDSDCGLTGDRDEYPEPVAYAVWRADCGADQPSPTPTPEPPEATPTPGVARPPSGLHGRTDCFGGEVSWVLYWADNTSDEMWFGVYVDGVWRASLEKNASRFAWPVPEAGRSYVAQVGAMRRDGNTIDYDWSQPFDFRPDCGSAPIPTPSPPPIPTATPTATPTVCPTVCP